MVFDGYDDTAHWECRYWAMCARQDRHTMEVNIALPSFTSLALAFSFFPANLVLAPNLATLSATCTVLLLLSHCRGHWGFYWSDPPRGWSQADQKNSDCFPNKARQNEEWVLPPTQYIQFLYVPLYSLCTAGDFHSSLDSADLCGWHWRQRQWLDKNGTIYRWQLS